MSDVDTKTLRKIYGLMGNGIMSNSIISCCDEIDSLRAELATAQARVKGLEEALVFLSDPGNYPGSADGLIWEMAQNSEAVSIARAALAEKP